MLGPHPAPPPTGGNKASFVNITMVVRLNDEILFSQGKHDAKHNTAKAAPLLILHTKFCYKDKTNL